ncbi:hypothetical protein RclHR1_04570003 [Rhizophagus clarus]|uniref:HIT domain-containing protein n=1 Tax=Rhizophagus clarus TaxID=94130 RepID=A0A2Z6RIA6_9GLOM|nr:hypothetical protein RclHR1_04570003 [Rhizophagus clarus]
MSSLATCLFCKIIKREIPSTKIFETDLSYAFLDIGPLSEGHSNNGPLAHQVVEHVHFHVIPKPNETEGLGIKWPSKQPTIDEVEATGKKMLEKLQSNS